MNKQKITIQDRKSLENLIIKKSKFSFLERIEDFSDKITKGNKYYINLALGILAVGAVGVSFYNIFKEYPVDEKDILLNSFIIGLYSFVASVNISKFINQWSIWGDASGISKKLSSKRDYGYNIKENLSIVMDNIDSNSDPEAFYNIVNKIVELESMRLIEVKQFSDLEFDVDYNYHFNIIRILSMYDCDKYKEVFDGFIDSRYIQSVNLFSSSIHTSFDKLSGA